jgi:uncharacterized GH25 family protein
MNRPKLNLFLILAAMLILPHSAHSHDGWIQVNSIVEAGQPVSISLMHGNHSNEHGSFRLAGKWDAQYTKLLVIEPSGKINDLTRTIVDLGEDPEKIGPRGPKGFHLAQFTPTAEGVYTVLARQERILQQGDGPKLRAMRNARSAFIALLNPKVSIAQTAKDFARTYSLQHVLEIIPVTNPFGITEKSSLTLEVLLDGRPAANQTVTVIGQLASAASAQDLTTDSFGRARVTVGAADTYLARVKFDQDTRQASGQLDKNSFEATYVFQVFHHR